MNSVFGEEQGGKFVSVDVVNPRQAGLDRTGDLAGEEAHGVQSVFCDLLGQQLIVAVEFLVVDHRHHPALVGIHKIRKLEFGIVQIQGHRMRSTTP